MATPVLFIHGLWLHASSWDPWAQLFREAGYEPHVPGWPGDGETVQASRANPDAIADHGIDDVVTHFAGIIEKLPTAPILIGHSFGGMIAQKLLGQDRALAAIAIDAAQIKGVLPVPLSALRATLPVFKNPANRHRAVSLTAEQFRYAFANAVSEEESDQLFERWTIPAPGRPLFEAATANFNPHSPAEGRDRQPDPRAPSADRQRKGPHRSRSRNPRDPQAVSPFRSRHRHHHLPGPIALADHRLRLARGGGHLPDLAQGTIAVNLGLTGRTAVVTGASKGIGLAVVQALVQEGARVTAGARHGSPELSELADRNEVAIVLEDLTTAAGCQTLVAESVTRFGGIDLLVNNVGGVHPRTKGFLDVTDADWQAAMEVNLFSAIRATRAAVPHLLRRAPSAIVTICSVNASLPDPGVIDYSAAKAALRNFCKSLSKELGPSGVRVNTVSPGPVETALWLGSGGVAETLAQAQGIDPTTVKAAAVAGTPTGRFTRPAEVAQLVLLLASETAGNITGTDVLIDGGLVTSL